MTFSKRLLMALCFVSMVVVTSVLAQDIPDFDEDFDNDIIEFEYPEDWEIEEYSNGTNIIIYSEGSSADLDTLVFGRPRNTFLFRIIVSNTYNTLNNPAAIAGFEFRAWADYLRVEQEVLDDYSISDEVETDEVNRNDYALITAEFVSLEGDEVHGAFLALEVDDEQFIVLAGFADNNDDDELYEMMLEFADSLDTCFPDC